MGTVKYSGPIASFHCPAEATIRSLKVHFSPMQEGSGDPSPDNVRKIGGRDGILLASLSNIKKFIPINFTTTTFRGVTLEYLGDGVFSIYGNCTESTTYFDLDIEPFYFENNQYFIVNTDSNDYFNQYDIVFGFKDENRKTIMSISPLSVSKTAIYSYLNMSDTEMEFLSHSECSKLRIVFRKDKTNMTFSFSLNKEIDKHIIDLKTDLGTIYGGWVDLISGEVCEEWWKTIADGVNVTCTPNGPYRNGDKFGGAIVYLNPLGVYDSNSSPTLYCDYLPKNKISSSQYLATTFAGNQYVVFYIYDINDYDGVLPDKTTIMNMTNSWLQEHPVTLVYKLKVPNTYSLAPTQLQTFLGHNNVWSNADYVEVEYDLHETQDILSRKNFIIANQPHVEEASGAIATFNTDIAAKLKECKVEFKPKQDLHGYSKPWVAGGGKNIAKPYDNSYVSSTYISFDYSAANGTFRCYGTASASSTHSSPSATNAVNNGATFTLPAGTYTLSIIDGDGANIYAQCVSSDETVLAETTSYTTFTTNESLTVFVRLKVAAAATVDKTVKIQLEKGSSATSYEPYENICPIEGWNGVIAGKASKNLLDVTLNDRSSYTATNGTVSTNYVGSGNGTRVWFSQIFSAGTYTISCDYSGEGTNGPRLLCSQFISNSTWNNSYQGYWKNFSGRSCTFTTEKPFSVGLVFISRAEHSGEPGVLYNIQFELGSSATEYEPYNGGTIPVTFPATTNLFNEQWEQGNIEVGNDAGSSTCMRTGFIDVNSSTSYYLYTPRESNVFVFEYLEDGTYADKVNNVYTSHVFTTGSTTKKIRIVDRNSGTETVNTGINYPSTITYYEPYGTIYGGYVDLVKGEVVETWHSVDMGRLDYTYRSNLGGGAFTATMNEAHGAPYPQNLWAGICSKYPYLGSYNALIDKSQGIGYVYNKDVIVKDTSVTLDDPTAMKASLSGTILCYPLAEPIHYQIDPITLKSLRGTNNIWSNANGNIELSYWKH